MTEEIIREVVYDRKIGLPVQGMEDKRTEYLRVTRENLANEVRLCE